ncbi:MAG: acyl carrier protein [Deltaproteobacteria bacterium]|nr:acyl carrier protein [Deltaproteobacteria bacterium]
MAGTNVERRVREIVAEQLGIAEDEILPSSSFQEDLGADSLDIVELVMAMEEEFGIEISEGDAEGIETVQELIEDIATRLET